MVKEQMLHVNPDADIIAEICSLISVLSVLFDNHCT